MKAKTLRDPLIPPGFKHRRLVKIPLNHVNSRLQQDTIEDGMARQIKDAPRGAKKDWLIADRELWRRNGSPTYYQPSRAVREARRAQSSPLALAARGKPLWMDFADDNEPRNVQRTLDRKAVR